MGSKAEKKRVRTHFRESVFSRDGHHCLLCPPEEVTFKSNLDAHHITDRHLMPRGGYVLENGITVCPIHHLQVENGIPTPDELYTMIGSCHQNAVKSSLELEQ